MYHFEKMMGVFADCGQKINLIAWSFGWLPSLNAG